MDEADAAGAFAGHYARILSGTIGSPTEAALALV